MSLSSEKTSERASRPLVGALRAIGIILFFALIGPPIGGLILFVLAASGILGFGPASFAAYLLLLFVFGSYFFGFFPALGVGVIAAAWQYYKQTPRVALTPVVLTSFAFPAAIVLAAWAKPSPSRFQHVSTMDAVIFLGLSICAGLGCRLLVNSILDSFDRRTRATMS